MIAYKFRFPTEAHTKWGDGWYELDFEALENDVDSGVIERFEDETDIQLMRELPDLLSRGSFRAIRAAMWLALLITGRRDRWAVFKADPHTDPRRAEWEADTEDEQSAPPPNRAQRRAKGAPGSSAT